MRKLIGDDLRCSVDHRILNIILISVFILAIWGAVTNYLLNLGALLVALCIMSSIIMAGLYYLSLIKNKHQLAGLLLMLAAFVTIPSLWILNGGISGSIPFYVILFSSIGVISFWNTKKIFLIYYFIFACGVLMVLEYRYPAIITGYSDQYVRYIDIFIALMTTIIANTVMMTIILKQYTREQEKGKAYLAQSLKTQADLTYISYHDALTGLFNRMYFEKLLTDYAGTPAGGLGVFAIDIDGLKFINDAFGHDKGDAMLISAAQVLEQSLGSAATIARVGGDEFAVIVAKTTRNEMETAYKRIRTNISRRNELAGDAIILQMSVGYSYGAGTRQQVRELLREADSKMYREKLYRQAVTKGSILQTVKKMLAARDNDTEMHSDRLQNLVAHFAVAAGVHESAIADIQLLAEFHDVGKVGVSDRILLKSGPLDKQEREQIRRHCEIGYRIAQTSTDLIPIADWILKHHEWWNGEGYPLGLKEKQIPLECRIIAIADSYDAMTNDRPYRRAISHEQAIKELTRCAGTQFDPELVEAFAAMMRQTPYSAGLAAAQPGL